MGYTQTYRDLCHGTDEKSAEKIIESGFEIKGRKDSWCGKGVYFYDIKKKAWWAANRKCDEIKKETGEKVNPRVLFADIYNLDDASILDMRAHSDLCDFEDKTRELLDHLAYNIKGIEDETERIILLRAMLISYYADSNGKKLVIGNFRQRPQPKYEHAIEFSNSLDMIFGIETIYCVKDENIIENVH